MVQKSRCHGSFGQDNLHKGSVRVKWLFQHFNECASLRKSHSRMSQHFLSVHVPWLSKEQQTLAGPESPKFDRPVTCTTLEDVLKPTAAIELFLQSVPSDHLWSAPITQHLRPFAFSGRGWWSNGVKIVASSPACLLTSCHSFLLVHLQPQSHTKLAKPAWDAKAENL